MRSAIGRIYTYVFDRLQTRFETLFSVKKCRNEYGVSSLSIYDKHNIREHIFNINVAYTHLYYIIDLCVHM